MSGVAAVRPPEPVSGDLENRPLPTSRRPNSNRSTVNSRKPAVEKCRENKGPGKPETTPSVTVRGSSVTLLGSGARTPWTGYLLDRATREAILHAEVGPLQRLPLASD